MIESNIIKRFIVKSFMQNNELEISKIADIVMETLSSRFLLNESVYVDGDVSGKISKCSRTIYKIIINNEETDVEFENIKRKMPVEHKDVCQFLECITKVTSLGRIVIENVFQKINEPGFGTPGYVEQPKTQPEVKLQSFSRSVPLRQKEQVHAKKASPVAESIVKPPKTVEAKVYSKPQTVELENLKKFTILEIKNEQMTKFMKIYLFFNTFSDYFSIEKFTFEEMVEAIKDADYSSKIIFLMHKILVEIIEKDLKGHGPKLISDLNLIFNFLPYYNDEQIQQQTKRRLAFDMDNWKTQIKIFIGNFSRDAECDRILRYLDFSKKENFNLRVEFLLFLIDVSYYTESIKNMVMMGLESVKNEKQVFDQIAHLKRKGGADVKEELYKCNDRIRQIAKNNIRNPVRAHVGKYKNYQILFIDGEFVLRNDSEYYKLGSKEINIILKELDSLDKYERITIMNLKEVMGTMSAVN